MPLYVTEAPLVLLFAACAISRVFCESANSSKRQLKQTCRPVVEQWISITERYDQGKRTLDHRWTAQVKQKSGCALAKPHQYWAFSKQLFLAKHDAIIDSQTIQVSGKAGGTMSTVTSCPVSASSTNMCWERFESKPATNTQNAQQNAGDSIRIRLVPSATAAGQQLQLFEVTVKWTLEKGVCLETNPAQRHKLDLSWLSERVQTLYPDSNDLPSLHLWEARDTRYSYQQLPGVQGQLLFCNFYSCRSKMSSVCTTSTIPCPAWRWEVNENSPLPWSSFQWEPSNVNYPLCAGSAGLLRPNVQNNNNNAPQSGSSDQVGVKVGIGVFGFSLLFASAACVCAHKAPVGRKHATRCPSKDGAQVCGNTSKLDLFERDLEDAAGSSESTVASLQESPKQMLRTALSEIRGRATSPSTPSRVANAEPELQEQSSGRRATAAALGIWGLDEFADEHGSFNPAEAPHHSPTMHPERELSFGTSPSQASNREDVRQSLIFDDLQTPPRPQPQRSAECSDRQPQMDLLSPGQIPFDIVSPAPQQQASKADDWDVQSDEAVEYVQPSPPNPYRSLQSGSGSPQSSDQIRLAIDSPRAQGHASKTDAWDAMSDEIVDLVNSSTPRVRRSLEMDGDGSMGHVQMNGGGQPMTLSPSPVAVPGEHAVLVQRDVSRKSDKSNWDAMSDIGPDGIVLDMSRSPLEFQAEHSLLGECGPNRTAGQVVKNEFGRRALFL